MTVAPTTDDVVYRRRGIDCTFFYRHQDGRLVERAVFDDGRIGGVYDAAGVIDPESDEIEELPASAWPTREGEDKAAATEVPRP